MKVHLYDITIVSEKSGRVLYYLNDDSDDADTASSGK